MIYVLKTKKAVTQFKIRLPLILMIALVVFLTGARANAQQTYSGAKVDYSVEFPSAMWRLVGEPDDTHQHTEWVYGDRVDGYLRILKETIDPNSTVPEFARNDQDTRIRFLPGYIDVGKEE